MAEKKPSYYSIREDAAKRAKDMNSFYDYGPGSGSLLIMRTMPQNIWNAFNP